jgi:hypothetical protein
MWCVPALDDDYLRAMDDVLETYERPLHDRIPVVCLDEKCVELRADTRAPRTTSNGVVLRDYEYERCGTANVFVMTEPKAGRHFARATKRRTRRDFAETLKFLADRYPKALTIPKHASWLNQAEIAINVFSQAVLSGVRVPSIQWLRRRATTFFRRRTRERWTINWMWTRKRANKWLATFRTRH